MQCEKLLVRVPKEFIMPRVKRQPARRLQQAGGSGSKSASLIDIDTEIDRWNGVKSAHELLNDMQVAKILLDWLVYVLDLPGVDD